MRMQKEVNFEIRPLNRDGPYFGFTLENPLHQMSDGTIFHNSGKSVMEQAM